MIATVTSLKPVAATAAITDRSSRSRCAARTVSGGRPFLPRGRPGSPSWVRASTPSCLVSGTLLNFSNALKYVTVLMWRQGNQAAIAEQRRPVMRAQRPRAVPDGPGPATLPAGHPAVCLGGEDPLAISPLPRFSAAGQLGARELPGAGPITIARAA